VRHDRRIPRTILRGSPQEGRIRVTVCSVFEQSAMYFSISIHCAQQTLFAVHVALCFRGVSPSPKPANAVFQEFNAGEDPHGYEGDCDCRYEEPEPDHRANTRKHPDHGGRGNPLHKPLTGDNDTGAQEPYARYHLTEHPSGIHICALKGGSQMDKNACAETDQDACAYPCRFPANLSLEPDNAAAQYGNANPDPELRRQRIHLISPNTCPPLV
jgi:hypothetical protein